MAHNVFFRLLLSQRITYENLKKLLNLRNMLQCKEIWSKQVKADLICFGKKKIGRPIRSIDFLEMSHEAIGNVSVCCQRLLF